MIFWIIATNLPTLKHIIRDTLAAHYVLPILFIKTSANSVAWKKPHIHPCIKYNTQNPRVSLSLCQRSLDLIKVKYTPSLFPSYAVFCSLSPFLYSRVFTLRFETLSSPATATVEATVEAAATRCGFCLWCPYATSPSDTLCATHVLALKRHFKFSVLRGFPRYLYKCIGRRGERKLQDSS